MNATVETQTSNKVEGKVLHFRTVKDMVQFFLPSIEGPGIPASQIAECISYPEQPSGHIKQTVFNALTELFKKGAIHRNKAEEPYTYTGTLPLKKMRAFRATLVTESRDSIWKTSLPLAAAEEFLGTAYIMSGGTEKKQNSARKLMAGSSQGIIHPKPVSDVEKNLETLNEMWSNLSVITSSDSAGQVHSNNVVKLLNDKGHGVNLPMWTGPLTTEQTGVQLDGDLLLGMLVEGRLSLNQMKALYLELKEVFE